MKIKCPGCEKAYEFPTEKLKPEGSKVKCTQCGRVFLVRPKSSAAAPSNNEDLGDLFGDGGPSSESVRAEDDSLDDFFGEASGDTPSLSEAAESEDEAEDLFGEPEGLGGPAAKQEDEDLFGDPDEDEDLFGNDEDLFGGGDDLFGAAPEEEADASPESSDEDELESLFDDSGADTDDLFGSPDEPSPTEYAGGDDDEEESVIGFQKEDIPDFDWDEDEDEGESADETAEASGSPPSEEDFQPAIREDEAERVLQKTVVQELPKEDTPKRSRAWMVWLLILVVLGGGVGAVAMNPHWVTDIEALQPLLAKFSDTVRDAAPQSARKKLPPSPVKKQGDLDIFRVANRKGTEMLVVRGTLVNTDSVPHSFIRPRVSFINQQGETVTSQTVYAGNVLSELQLKTFQPEELQNRLQAEMGDNLANFNVRPGARIDFMALFVPDPRPEGNYKPRVRVVKSLRGEQS